MYQNDSAKLFHELSHPKSSLYPIIHNSQPVVDPHIKASLFNVCFNSVFTTSDFILPPTYSLPSPTDLLSSIVIDVSDVFEAISSLNPSKAPGIDYINPLILKTCADPFPLQFTHLLNSCFDSCSWPNDWKIHKITPIHKGKSRSDVANYRPISLLCIMSKVLESIVFRKILISYTLASQNFNLGF